MKFSFYLLVTSLPEIARVKVTGENIEAIQQTVLEAPCCNPKLTTLINIITREATPPAALKIDQLILIFLYKISVIFTLNLLQKR